MSTYRRKMRSGGIPLIAIATTLLIGGPAAAQPPSEIELPVVVIDDRDAAKDIDWAAAKAEGGMSFSSRWDNLTLVDSCLWATPEELAEHLGISMPIETRRVDFQCRYYVGNFNVFLSIWLERHRATETVRKAEYDLSEGFPKIQFTRLDTGDPDLHAYAHNGAFPANGRTLWRIQFLRPGPERDAVIGPSGDTNVRNGIGPRFLALLVEKYGDQL